MKLKLNIDLYLKINNKITKDGTLFVLVVYLKLRILKFQNPESSILKILANRKNGPDEWSFQSLPSLNNSKIPPGPNSECWTVKNNTSAPPTA